MKRFAKTIFLTSLPAKCLTILGIALALFHHPAFAQNSITVKGRVADVSGNPVLNASVVIKGSNTGVSTAAGGNFEITVPSNGTLVITSVGFAPQEVRVDNRKTINITLASSETNLGEVVVVGYGTQRKRDVTGAISKVTSETLLQTASHNVIDQLKGHAAGVNITSTSAVPGGGSQIRIRGNRTMVQNTQPNSVTGSTFSTEAAAADQADAPLIVVDGIPYSGNLNDISPNDISNLEILKDASATAIYGSRGAGGVILVTTKRGTTGKVTFNYSAYYGVSKIMKQLRVFNGSEYAQFKLDAAAGHGTTPGTQPWPLSAAEQAALTAGVSTDWQDLIYQNAPITNHNLGINGGSDKSRYSMSFGYFYQGGIIPKQDYKRFSIRSAMDHQVSNRIKIGLTTNNSVSYQNTPGGSGVTNGLMRITPLASPYNADGSVNLQILTGSTDNLFNPLTLKTRSEAILARNRRLRTFNSLYGEVDIIKGLKYRINIGLDFYQDKADGYSGPGTFVNSALSQTQSNGNVRNTEFWQYTIENLLFYNKTYKKHNIGLTALYSVQKSQSTSSFASGIGIPFDYMQNADLYQAASVNAGSPGSNYFWERGLISYMGRLTYGYDGRYSLTATVRRDGSSVLSPGKQYYTYPALAAAWNIMSEKFMANKLTFINNLKLRVGWGVAASQGINPYATLGGLSSAAYNYGQGTGGQQGAYTIGALPNKTLKWQSTSQFNFGLDFAVLRNRITGSIEVYSQKTKDILLPLQLPASQGGTTIVKNLGKTKGSGLELTINSINIRRSNGFEWSTEFNYFFNREKITQLANANQQNDIGNGWFVGQPITVIYDYEKIGIWQTGDPGLSTQTSPVQKAGDIRLRDVNNDGKITPDDRVIVGNFQPKFEMGLSNTVKFKRFDFSISMYARVGMKVVVPYLSSETGGANFTGFNWFLTGRNNQLKVDYWTPTNPTNKFPQPDASGTPQYSSTLTYVDGSFIKCRAINLGYEIPNNILGRVGVSSFRAYISIVNPFVVWSPFVKEGYGPDPEGNGYGGGIRAQGTNEAGTVGRQITVNANNPATRQFIFGVNLNF